MTSSYASVHASAGGCHCVRQRQKKNCCLPSRDSGARPDRRSERTGVGAVAGAQYAGIRDDRLIPLAGGTFTMGSTDRDAEPKDGEGPLRRVGVNPFAVATCAVSNAEFAHFVDTTGYVTDAERAGWSFVFAAFLPRRVRAVSPRPDAIPWWCAVQGASWRYPEGPGSRVDHRLDHPVVHVSWNDARAYASWIGGLLPTEAQWEYAARGGLHGARFPWGDDLMPGGEHRCNIWQGTFPTRNTAEDGYTSTAPVDAFPPNGFGLHNVVGNVWEWCADWWASDRSVDRADDPRGPERGEEKVMRGGSYLCHESYCNRYRVAARTKNTPDSSAGNLGFRCVRPVRAPR